MTRLLASAVARSQNLDGRARVVRPAVPLPPEILKSRLVDGPDNDRGLGSLNRVVSVLHPISARDQIEAAHAGVANIALRERVAEAKRGVFAQLIVDPGAGPKAALRRREHAAKRLRSERPR